MLKRGILNPQINFLLCRIRHTNTLVIADRGFPFWPQIETIDLTLIDDIPTVLDVLKAVSENFVIGKAWMASEFRDGVSPETIHSYAAILPSIQFEEHARLKQRVPFAIGLIRTADTIPFSNIILESA